MAANWYVQQMGETVGPLTSEELTTRARSRQLSPDDWVRRGEDGKWTSAGNVKGLFPHDQSAPQYAPPAAVCEVPGAIPSRPTKTSTLAIISLGAGVPGLLCFPAGLVAIILGGIALLEIKSPRTDKVGWTLAWSGIVLGVIGQLVCLFVLLLPKSPPTAPTTVVAQATTASAQKHPVSPSAAELESRRQVDLETKCDYKSDVRRFLKHPLDASFSWFPSRRHLEDGGLHVVGTVKAKNDFGAELTSEYFCEYDRDANLVCCTIDGKLVYANEKAQEALRSVLETIERTGMRP